MNFVDKDGTTKVYMPVHLCYFPPLACKVTSESILVMLPMSTEDMTHR